MSAAGTSAAARKVVEDVLGKAMVKEIWTAGYDKLLPLTVDHFDISDVLPAVFYMFRFARRRGKGRFLELFGGEGTPAQQRKNATVDKVTTSLADMPTIEGFRGEAQRAILGDMLLAFTLENIRKEPGRDKQVQHVAPAHFFASWVDLPLSIVNLRFVPEMLVALLADQDGERVEPTREGEKTWFPVGADFENNVLLRPFDAGVVFSDLAGDLAGDRYDEKTDLSVDELLAVRLAQLLGEAPKHATGKEPHISNQRPIAERAARHFSEDLRNFVRGYAGVIPRHTFVNLLESSISLGLSTIVTASLHVALVWSQTGRVVEAREQRPADLFVDVSNGVDRDLRAIAEQSMDATMRRLVKVPSVLMAMRILDFGVRHDRRLKKERRRKTPYATEWLNLLGQVLLEEHPDSSRFLDNLDDKASQLADALEDADYAEVAAILRDDESLESPVWRMAEALTLLYGREGTLGKVWKLFDSSFHTGRPNGLAHKRRVNRISQTGAGRSSKDARSVIFTNPMLDYLVHRLVLKPGKHGKLFWRPLPMREFLEQLRTRYGLYVDTAPPGLDISNELLQRNREILERRLRDLGLLRGVNDAESMKTLRPHYEPNQGGEHELD